ncbi:MAG: aminopeptidase P family protein [Alphaproteobacteria bacterium]
MDTHEDRLEAFRGVLRGRGLSGFVVPRSDAHQGEYVAPCSERLRWLTGFSGSAGRAVILDERAALFVDGRYILEAARVLSGSYEARHFLRSPVGEWLEESGGGGKLGYDPWHSTYRQVRELEVQALAGGFTLTEAGSNPVDELWADRPAAPGGEVVAHPLGLTGESAADKCARVAEGVSGVADWVILTLPDSIAWLFNARGSDLACVPVVLSFAALGADGRAVWFVDGARLDSGLSESLAGVVECRPADSFVDFLSSLGGKRVLLDPDSAPEHCFRLLAGCGAEVVHRADPCLLPKACKNGVELRAIREAHCQDGVALCRFLHWLEGAVAGGGVSELSASGYLYGLRSEGRDFRGLSFETISGSGPNGAVMHYRVSEGSSRALSVGEPYLVDSGGQYSGGTTDVTRTVCFSPPDEEFRRRFTQVLQGHIEVARARFPVGVTGSGIDPLARQFLWRDGVDYDHGTGHGVGAYLSVHEGPQAITSRSRVALEAGMVISNEPGFYKEGEYGIRIENLVEVCTVEDGSKGLGFSTLTLAPIQRVCIEVGMLSVEQREWLNGYHRRVREEITPRLGDDGARRWLEEATIPI